MHLFSWLKLCIVFFSSLAVTEEQSQLICPHEPVTACVGDDVVLPCRLDPPTTASSRAIEWTRPGLDPEYIHVHQDGRLVFQSQNPLFSYRTALFVDQLANGNVSLKLLRVKTSDSGKYKIFIPSLWKEASVQVTVGEDGKVCKGDSTQVSCMLFISISGVFGILLFLTLVLLVLLVWKWRKSAAKKTRPRKKNKDQLLMESINDSEGKEAQLREELQKKEEEQKEITHTLETLTGQSKDLETQKNLLNLMKEKTEKKAELRDKGIELVDKEVSQKDGDKTTNRAQGYNKLREILEEDSENQQERKRELQELNMGLDKLMRNTFGDINEIKKRKEKVENQVEQIKKQIIETKIRREGMYKKTSV